MLIDCPNLCQKSKVERKNMQDHLENECSKRVEAASLNPPVVPFVATITKFSNVIKYQTAWFRHFILMQKVTRSGFTLLVEMVSFQLLST